MKNKFHWLSFVFVHLSKLFSPFTRILSHSSNITFCYLDYIMLCYYHKMLIGSQVNWEEVIAMEGLLLSLAIALTFISGTAGTLYVFKRVWLDV